MELQIIIDYLTKKLGHPPTNDELRDILNGVGLIVITEEIKKAS